MTQDAFQKSVDQTRLDRLREAILTAAGDFEAEGYGSMEVTRALLWASYRRAGQEKDISIWSSFVQFARDHATWSLARDEALKKKVCMEYIKGKGN